MGGRTAAGEAGLGLDAEGHGDGESDVSGDLHGCGLGELVYKRYIQRSKMCVCGSEVDCWLVVVDVQGFESILPGP